MNPAEYFDRRGRLVAQAMWSELEKIAQYTTLAQANSAPPQAMPGSEAIGEGGAPTEESSPLAPIMGTRVEPLSAKQARGFPIVPAPPGYVFAPDLQAFVPDMSQPGWIPEEAVPAAMNNKGYYDQGAADQATAGAQDELDKNVAQTADAAAQQAAADQQEAAMQEAAAMKAEQKAMTQAKKDQLTGGVAAAGNAVPPRGGAEESVGSPAAITGAGPRKSSKKGRNKGIRIEIGR